MKRIVYLFSVMAITGLLLFACKGGDECQPTNCVNGTCMDGECACDFGWAGELCDRTCESLLVDNYTVSQSCDNGGAEYLSSIYPDTSDSTRYFFTNLYSFTGPDSIYCTYDSCMLTLPAQGDPALTISGSGQWRGDDILINLTVIENGVQTIGCQLDFNRL